MIRLKFQTILLFLTFQIWLISALSYAPGSSLSYCSSENTGSGLVNSSIYQSDGACFGICNERGYALAIVQYQDCWCSNYLPADTVSTDECDLDCPGYPSNKCGGEGLYGYIYVSEPSGTVSAGSATSSTSSTSTTSTSTTPISTIPTTTSSTTSTASTLTSTTPTSTPTSTTAFSTMTSSSSWIPPTTSSTSTIPSTTSTSSTSTTTKSSSTTSTSSSSTSSISSTSTSLRPTSTSTTPTTSSTPKPATSTSTINSSTAPATTSIITSVIYSISTINGGQTTQYVTTGIQTTIESQPASTSSSDSLANATGVNDQKSAKKSNISFFDNKGKVAGVFTAVGVVAVVIISLMIWFITRRLRNKNRDDYDDEDVVGVKGFSRDGNQNKGNGGLPIVTKTNILNDDDEVSSTDDTVINEKQHYISNVSKQGSVTRPTSIATATTNGHNRNISLVSTDFGTPIIDNHGASTYIDQRLDANTFSNISERDEILSLNDNEDYSRRVFRITNP